MRCAIYLRVSTEEQSLEPQRVELTKYVAARGWTHTPEIDEFTDVISGSTTERDGFDRLMAAVREKHYDAVLVVRLDRLARSLTHFAKIVAEFDKLGVALIAPAQNIDTSRSNPGGRLQMHVMAAVAEFERSLISERTKAGLAVVKARGVQLGKPSKVLVANWREIVNEFLTVRDGVGYRQLAKDLGGVSQSTAHRLTKRVLNEQRAG